MGAGQERVDTHEVNHHTALDLLDQGAFDRLIVLIREADLLPHAHEVGFLLREDDCALLILEMLEEDFDFIAGLDRLEVLEFLARDRAFRPEADVENDGGVVDRLNASFHDLALVDRRHGALVELHHPLVVGGGVLVFVVELGSTVGKRAELTAQRVAPLALRQRTGWGGWGLQFRHTERGSPGIAEVLARRAES